MSIVCRGRFNYTVLAKSWTFIGWWPPAEFWPDFALAKKWPLIGKQRGVGQKPRL
jgi:hypothetical protein